MNPKRKNNGDPITLVLVEDQIEVAYAIRIYLELQKDFDVLAMAHTEKDFQAAIRQHTPDIALVDLGLSTPDSGLELIRWLGAEYPAILPVALTADQGSVRRCYEAGARGYILKSKMSDMPAILHKVHNGDIIIPPGVSDILVRQLIEQEKQLRRSTVLNFLSKRELEILVLLKKGSRRESIAKQLGISYHTVRRHLYLALEKTGFPTIQELLKVYGDAIQEECPSESFSSRSDSGTAASHGSR